MRADSARREAELLLQIQNAELKAGTWLVLEPTALAWPCERCRCGCRWRFAAMAGTAVVLEVKGLMSFHGRRLARALVC